MAQSFIKLVRSPVVDNLLKYPNCFTLLTVIALRTQREGEHQGEAMIGDIENYGMSEGQYRGAKRKLESLGVITTKVTNKATFAKIIDDTIFDLNIKAANNQTNEQKTSNYEEEFEQFWQAYPARNGKKVGKKMAHKEFIKVMPAVRFEVLMEAVRGYAVSCNGFPKDAERFLKHEIWKDCLEGDRPADKVVADPW